MKIPSIKNTECKKYPALLFIRYAPKINKLRTYTK